MYRQTIFYEYVNISLETMTKYEAIQKFLNDPRIPIDYKYMKCVKDEYNHSLTLLDYNPVNNNLEDSTNYREYLPVLTHESRTNNINIPRNT